ncbi:DNA-binding CsgD family transcriptional regulator [Rhizobium leucaenae]|uniref:DNA-binding CsgD family transcriptional regulator n=1 Tax=Rhizobium leucaenae TaxID=29450 RepID=A0A7W7ENI2_9HYPH|nr:DNA-binding CsgD family transcriptional regulator [Rhizobium leucaenae]
MTTAILLHHFSGRHPAGKTAIEIAGILGRSHRTIQNEILNVQRKLNVVNAAQMIAESFRFGILR